MPTGKEGETYRDILAHLASNRTVLAGDIEERSFEPYANTEDPFSVLSTGIDGLIQ